MRMQVLSKPEPVSNSNPLFVELFEIERPATAGALNPIATLPSEVIRSLSLIVASEFCLVPKVNAVFLLPAVSLKELIVRLTCLCSAFTRYRIRIVMLHVLQHHDLKVKNHYHL